MKYKQFITNGYIQNSKNDDIGIFYIEIENLYSEGSG